MSEFTGHKDWAAGHSSGAAHLKRLADYESGLGEEVYLSAREVDALCWDGIAGDLVRNNPLIMPVNMYNMGPMLSLFVECRMVCTNVGERNHQVIGRKLSYSLYSPGKLTWHINGIGPEASAANADLITVPHEQYIANAIAESVNCMVMGIDSGAMKPSRIAALSRVQTQPCHVEFLAVKGVMLLRQLILLHALGNNPHTLKAGMEDFVVNHCPYSTALDASSTHQVVVNVDDYSEEQVHLIADLTRHWPFQKLTVPGAARPQQDYYSCVNIKSDSLYLYGTSLENFQRRARTEDPAILWNNLVQLFSVLGGLHQLIKVVRETRGLVQTLRLLCETMGRRDLCCRLHYPPTSCYVSLNAGKQHRLDNFAQVSQLEASTTTIVVDCLLGTAFLNNCHMFCETIGAYNSDFMSHMGVCANRMNELAITGGLHSTVGNPLVHLLTPWLSCLVDIGKHYYALVQSFPQLYVDEDSPVWDMVFLPLNLMLPKVSAITSLSILASDIDLSGSYATGMTLTKDKLLDALRNHNNLKTIFMSRPGQWGISIVGENHLPHDYFAVQAAVPFRGSLAVKGLAVNAELPERGTCDARDADGFFKTNVFLESKNEVVNPGLRVSHTGHTFSKEPLEYGAEDEPPAAVSCDGSSDAASSDPIGHAEALAAKQTVQIEVTPDIENAIQNTGVNNCGIEALHRSILTATGKSIDIEGALGLIGVKVTDGRQIHDDELSAIAAHLGYALTVIISGVDTEVRNFTGEGPRVSVYFTGDNKSGHYGPAKPAPRTSRRGFSVEMAPLSIEAAKQLAVSRDAHVAGRKPEDMVATERATKVGGSTPAAIISERGEGLLASLLFEPELGTNRGMPIVKDSAKRTSLGTTPEDLIIYAPPCSGKSRFEEKYAFKMWDTDRGFDFPPGGKIVLTNRHELLPGSLGTKIALVPSPKHIEQRFTQRGIPFKPDDALDIRSSVLRSKDMFLINSNKMLSEVFGVDMDWN